MESSRDEWNVKLTVCTRTYEEQIVTLTTDHSAHTEVYLLLASLAEGCGQAKEFVRWCPIGSRGKALWCEGCEQEKESVRWSHIGSRGKGVCCICEQRGGGGL